MSMKRLATLMGALALITVLGVFSVSAALAQTDTPTTPDTAPKTEKTAPWLGGRGFGFGGRGGSFENFDAMAEALNLTPTQLFEQLHSGKTLAEIAEAQGVDLAAVQEAANAARVQAMKDAIAQAVTDGKITQERADWLLQGLDKGYLGKGRGLDFGFGSRGHGGMRGGGMRGITPAAPTTTPGTSS